VAVLAQSVFRVDRRFAEGENRHYLFLHNTDSSCMEVPVNRFGSLGILGVIGVWTNEPGLYALFALFALFASDRTFSLPVGDDPASAAR